MKASLTLVGAIALVLAACKGHEFHPPDKNVRVAQADSLYSEVAFDTLTWASAAERLQVGNEVYARKCDKCHSPSGEDTTEYARAQNLNVPALIDTVLQHTGDARALRHRIFIGHAAGMPTWGVANLTAREIDAVTAYVLEQLGK